MRIVPVLGNVQQRLRALDTPDDVYVINRENTQWLVEHSEILGRLIWLSLTKVLVSKILQVSDLRL